MFVCANRYIAYDLYKIIIELRPEWAEKKVCADGAELTDKDKKELKPIEKIRMVKLSEIKPMTDRDYTIRGCTALIDAIGGAIHHIGNVHKYARPEDVPAHTMFIITTDGMENASRKYTSDRVKQMIERQKERYGWEFLFIGANIDAVETAARYGIDSDRAVNYNADKEGTMDCLAAPPIMIIMDARWDLHSKACFSLTTTIQMGIEPVRVIQDGLVLLKLNLIRKNNKKPQSNKTLRL